MINNEILKDNIMKLIEEATSFIFMETREEGVNYGSNNGKYLFGLKITQYVLDDRHRYIVEEIGGCYGDLEEYPEPRDIDYKEGRELVFSLMTDESLELTDIKK